MASDGRLPESMRFTRLEHAATEGAGVCHQLAASVAQHVGRLFETRGLVEHGTNLALQTGIADDPMFVRYDTIDWGQTSELPNGHQVRLVAARAPERGSPVQLLATTARNHAFPIATVLDRGGVIDCDYLQLGMDRLDPTNLVVTNTDPLPALDPEQDRQLAITSIKRLVEIDPRRTKLGNPRYPNNNQSRALYESVKDAGYEIMNSRVAEYGRKTYAAAAVLGERSHGNSLALFSDKNDFTHPLRKTHGGDLKMGVALQAGKVRRAISAAEPDRILEERVPGSEVGLVKNALLAAWLDQHNVPATKYDKNYSELLIGAVGSTGAEGVIDAVVGTFQPGVERLVTDLVSLAEAGRVVRRSVPLVLGGEVTEGTAIIKARLDQHAAYADQWVQGPANPSPNLAGTIGFNLYAGNHQIPETDISELSRLLR